MFLLKKYKKWGVLWVAVCPSYIQDAGFLKVKQLYLGFKLTLQLTASLNKYLHL
jgi:hypothetical protein